MILHRMAICTSLGIAAEVTEALAITERECAQTADHPEANRRKDGSAANSKCALLGTLCSRLWTSRICVLISHDNSSGNAIGNPKILPLKTFSLSYLVVA